MDGRYGKGVEKIFTGRKGTRAHACQARRRVLPFGVTCSPPMCFAVRHVPFRCVLLSVCPVLLSVASCYPSRLAIRRVDGLPSVASWSLVGCLPSHFTAVRCVVVVWESEDKREMGMGNEGGLTSEGGEGVVWRSKKKTRRENFCSST